MVSECYYFSAIYYMSLVDLNSVRFIFYFSAAGGFTDRCVLFRFYVTMLNVLFFTSCQNNNHSSQNGGRTIGVSLDHRKCRQLKHTNTHTHTHTHTHTQCSQTVISSHPCPITAGFTTERAKVINLSPNPKCIGRHEGMPAHYQQSTPPWHFFMLHGPLAVCLAYLLLLLLHPPLPPPGHSRLEGAGVGHGEARLVRGDFPLSLLALRWVGWCGDWRSATDCGQPAGLLPLQRQQRVLERPGGEGLRQVSTRANRYTDPVWEKESQTPKNLNIEFNYLNFCLHKWKLCTE